MCGAIRDVRFGSKADVKATSANVHLVPQADVPRLVLLSSLIDVAAIIGLLAVEAVISEPVSGRCRSLFGGN